MHAWFSVSQNNSRLCFVRLVFPGAFCVKSERTNRNLPARNTMAQVLVLCADPRAIGNRLETILVADRQAG